MTELRPPPCTIIKVTDLGLAGRPMFALPFQIITLKTPVMVFTSTALSNTFAGVSTPLDHATGVAISKNEDEKAVGDLRPPCNAAVAVPDLNLADRSIPALPQ